MGIGLAAGNKSKVNYRSMIIRSKLLSPLKNWGFCKTLYGVKIRILLSTLKIEMSLYEM